MRINTHCERAEATDFARLIHWRVAYFRVAAAAANTAVAARTHKLCECGFQLAVFSESLCAPSAFYPLCLCACGRPQRRSPWWGQTTLRDKTKSRPETLSLNLHAPSEGPKRNTPPPAQCCYLRLCCGHTRTPIHVSLRRRTADKWEIEMGNMQIWG
jgi:hypothetical protein